MDTLLKNIELKATVNGIEVPLELGEGFKLVVTGTVTVDFGKEKEAE